MARREYVGVAFVALLVIASGGATYADGGGQPSVTATTDVDATESVVDDPITRFTSGDVADEVYVDRDGDAVFRYETDHGSPAVIPVRGELGVEAGTGLVHARYASDLTRVTVHDQDVTGTATTWARPASITATGEAVLEDPDGVQSVSADLRSVRSAETESASLELAGTVTNDTRPDTELETAGEIEITSSTVSTSGTVRTTVPDDRTGDDGPIALDERRTVTITETDGTIGLEATETRTVGEWERDRWETEADARASLENQYDELAILLGGDATIDLESYAFEADGDRETVELEYTVALEDVREGLAEHLAAELEATADIELDEHEARVIADRLAATSIEEITVDVDRRGLETTLEWDVEVHDTDELMLGLVEIAGSTDDGDSAWAGQYDEVQAALEAQEAADLVRETTWEGTVEHDGELTTVDAVVESDAANWTRYTTEREERGIDPVPDPTTATLTAETIDDDLAVEYEYETSTDGPGAAAFEGAVVDGSFGPATDVAGVPITDAAFDVARVDARVDEEGVEVESAAVLEDATTIGDVSGDDVTAIHVETSSDRTTVYVTTEAFVDANTTVGEIRTDPRVGPATHVYGPDEWDREFPSIDADAVRSFLEVDVDDEREESPAVVPPITVLAGGVGLAVVVSAVVLWFPWRRVVDRDRDRSS